MLSHKSGRTVEVLNLNISRPSPIVHGDLLGNSQNMKHTTMILTLVPVLVTIFTSVAEADALSKNLASIQATWPQTTLGFTFAKNGLPFYDAASWKKESNGAGSRYTNPETGVSIDIQSSGGTARYGYFQQGGTHDGLNIHNSASVVVVKNGTPDSYTKLSYPGGPYTVTANLCRELAAKSNSRDLKELKTKGEFCGSLVSTVAKALGSNESLEKELRARQSENIKHMGTMASAKFVKEAGHELTILPWSKGDEREGAFFNKELGAKATRAATAISDAVEVCSNVFPDALKPRAETAPKADTKKTILQRYTQ